MNQLLKHSPISDRQVETVLNRLHKEAKLNLKGGTEFSVKVKSS
jgi:hypothetical protein